MSLRSFSFPEIDDPDRLSALDAHGILDTLPEQGFDDVVRLATRLCAVPVALVSFVAADRQWFKANVGFPHCETDLDRSVCKHALAETDLLVIPDLSQDRRTARNPLVTGDPGIRFYAGAPLRTPEGQTLGSLCVIDTLPRPAGLTAEQADDLRALARSVESLLAMRRAVEHRDMILDLQNVELRQARRLDVLAKASEALLGADDPAAVLDPILSASADVLGFDRSYTYDLWPDGTGLRLTHSFGATEDVQSYLRHLPYGAPLCGIVAEQRQPLILTELQNSVVAEFQNAKGIGLDAYAGFPIMSRGKLRGVVSFASTVQPSFDGETLAFFATVARLLSAVHERLDGELALRESDTRSRLAQEAGRVGTFEVDVATGAMSVSPVFAEIYGVSPDGSHTAETFEALIPPEDRPQASNVASRQDGTAAPEAEYRIRRAGDGALRWIARRASFVRDEGGRVMRMFGTVQDVTDRHVAQTALKESEDYWRGLFECLTEGYIVGEVVRGHDGTVRDWRYVDVNAAWGSLVGIDPAGVMGRTIREVFPGIEDAWVDEFADVVNTGNPVTFVRQVGTLARWYEGRAFRLGPERFGVIFLEVTARIEAEARRDGLLELGERLRTDLDASGAAMAGAAVMGRVLGVGRVGYGTVGPDGETFTVERDWTAPGFPSLAGRYRMDDYGLYADDLREGRAVIVADVREDPRTAMTADALEAVSVRTLVNIPVVEKGRTVAVLYVNDDRPRIWSAAEVAFVRQVTELIRQAVERRRAEERQDLLNHELSHRLKNTLAMVGSIASQTLRSVPDRTPVRSFEQRLQALSSAHDMLLRRNWTSASLRSVCEEVLHNVAQPERFVLEGPDVELGPVATMSVSLLLHELATNAAKYGGLSTSTGRIDIRWFLDGVAEHACLEMRWRERGGPPVVEPTGRGFGSRLIRMGLVGTGGVEVCYHPDGFEATMRAQLVEVQRS